MISPFLSSRFPFITISVDYLQLFLYLRSDSITNIIALYYNFKFILIDMKMYWNDRDGCFVTKIKTGQTEEEVIAYFTLLVTHLHENKFQVVDLFFQNICSGL